MDLRWLASGGVHKGKQAGWFTTTSDGRMASSILAVVRVLVTFSALRLVL